jgi:hypothetical protein
MEKWLMEVVQDEVHLFLNFCSAGASLFQEIIQDVLDAERCTLLL